MVWSLVFDSRQGWDMEIDDGKVVINFAWNFICFMPMEAR